jgi:hypothetical protein
MQTGARESSITIKLRIPIFRRLRLRAERNSLTIENVAAELVEAGLTDEPPKEESPLPPRGARQFRTR